MQRTTNLDLILPSGEDYVNVDEQISGNFQKIDDGFGVLQSNNITNNITFDTSITSTTDNSKLYSQDKMRVLSLIATLKTGTTSISARTTTKIATVSEDDKPSVGFQSVIYRYVTSGQVISDIRLSINSSGEIYVCCENALSGNNWLVRGELIWFVD